MERKLDAREARRRKILSRGTDRLAFITGQSQTLSEPDPPSHPLSDVGPPVDESESSVSTENEANEAISSTEVESSTPKEAIPSRTISETDNDNSNLAPGATNTSIFKEITNTISASENVRMMCSVLIALYVIVSGFSPSLKFKPLVLVLVTDLTIILGRALGKGVGDVSSWAVDTGKVLDVAFLLMQLMDAIITDCSLCALIMICAYAVRSS